MVQAMLTVMFLENYCRDLMVFFDANAKDGADVWSHFNVYRREEQPENGPIDYYASGALNITQIKQNCGSYWINDANIIE